MLENRQLRCTHAGSCLQLLSTAPGGLSIRHLSRVRAMHACRCRFPGLGSGSGGNLTSPGSKNRVFSQGKGGRERSTNGGVSPVFILSFFQVIVGCCRKLLFQWPLSITCQNHPWLSQQHIAFPC